MSASDRRAYWYSRLKEYERAMNMLHRETLTDEETEALYTVHGLLRSRASGGQET